MRNTGTHIRASRTHHTHTHAHKCIPYTICFVWINPTKLRYQLTYSTHYSWFPSERHFMWKPKRGRATSQMYIYIPIGSKEQWSIKSCEESARKQAAEGAMQRVWGNKGRTIGEHGQQKYVVRSKDKKGKGRQTYDWAKP